MSSHLAKFAGNAHIGQNDRCLGTGTDGLPFAKTPQYSDQQPRMLTQRMTHACAWAEGHF
jgi:hypothetical protein